MRFCVLGQVPGDANAAGLWSTLTIAQVYSRDVKLLFTRGHIGLAAAFKGPNVILGLHKCNYS